MAREARESYAAQPEDDRRHLRRQALRPDQIPAGFEGYGKNEGSSTPAEVDKRHVRTPEQVREAQMANTALEATIRKTLRPQFEGKESRLFDQAVAETIQKARIEAGPGLENYSVKQAVRLAEEVAGKALTSYKESLRRLDGFSKNKKNSEAA